MSKLIEKERIFYKECGVVMLEAGRGTIALYKKTGNMAKPNFNVGIFESDVYQPQHLYITSDDEIKEGDWVIVTNVANGEMFVKQHKGIATSLSSPRKKIIATTDKSLVNDNNSFLGKPLILPQPSDKFIQAYIDAYNKGEKIEKVLVEYGLFCNTNKYPNIKTECNCPCTEEINCGITLKLKDNNIIIKKVKDSWTREEVINLLHSAGKYGRETANKSIGEMPNMMDKWIKENL